MLINFDAKGTATNAGLGTIQWTHTVGNGLKGNGIIFAFLLDALSAGSVTNVTFAGTNMTKIISGTNTTNAVLGEMWFLLNPPTGLGTFHGTFSAVSGAEDDALSLSYSGVAQTTPILGSAFKVGTVTNTGFGVGRNLTGTNSWWIGAAFADNKQIALTTGNLRGTAANAGELMGADNTAGTLVFNGTIAPNWVTVGAEVAPFVGGSLGYLGLMGAGKS